MNSAEQKRPQLQSAKHNLRQSRLWQNRCVWLLALVTGIWLVFTLAYAGQVSSRSGTGIASSIPSSTVVTRTLRILSEGVSVLLTGLIASTAAVVMWTAASTSGGTDILTLLGMSPTTGPWGLLQLLLWKSSGTTHRHFWLWPSIRLSSCMNQLTE